MFTSRGDVFKHDATADVTSVAQCVTHRHRIDQPRTQPGATLPTRFVDIVFKGGLVALDVDVKHLLYPVAVVEKRATRQRLTLADFAAQPCIVQVLERDAPIAADGVHQPHIAVDQVAGHYSMRN